MPTVGNGMPKDVSAAEKVSEGETSSKDRSEERAKEEEEEKLKKRCVGRRAGQAARVEITSKPERTIQSGDQKRGEPAVAKKKR